MVVVVGTCMQVLKRHNVDIMDTKVGERGDDLQSFLEEAPNQFDQVTKKTIKKKEDILPLQVGRDSATRHTVLPAIDLAD